jgi:hypothetical protein
MGRRELIQQTVAPRSQAWPGASGGKRGLLNLASAGLKLGAAACLALLLMHDQASLSSNALSQRSFSNLQRHVCRLAEQLGRRLNLGPAANGSIIELLQPKLFGAHHAITMMRRP